jgi:hypothetical protein
MVAWLTHYLQGQGGPMPSADIDYEEPKK